MEAARLRNSFVVTNVRLTRLNMKLLREYLIQEQSYDGIRGNTTLRNAYLTRSSASLGVVWSTSSRTLRRTGRTVTMTSGVPRGVVWGVQTPPSKFRRYQWNPRSHEQGKPVSRFPFVVHFILIRL